MAKPSDAAAKFENLDWKYLIGAVIEIFRANQRMYLLCTRPAKSREWVLFSELRHTIWACVRAEWAVRTGSPELLFPYSEDYVVHLYAIVKEKDGAELKLWENECATRKPEKKKPKSEGTKHGVVDAGRTGGEGVHRTYGDADRAT